MRSLLFAYEPFLRLAAFAAAFVIMTACGFAVRRPLVATPDLQRVHHSIPARETNSNFGFNPVLQGAPFISVLSRAPDSQGAAARA